jgi:ketosteroid isomerase-like protein
MDRSSLSAFSALWRAYGEGRLERSLDLVDPECELTLPDGRSMFRGHEGVREWLANARRDWKTVTITYEDVHETHPGCVVGVGQLAASSTDGNAKVERPLACVAEFRDGRLVRGRAFSDRDAALRYARELGVDR